MSTCRVFDHQAVLLPLRAVSPSNVFTAFLCNSNGRCLRLCRVVLTSCNFTSLPRFDGNISLISLCLGCTFRFSFSHFFCGWLKGSSNENLYRILRSIVPCYASNVICACRSRMILQTFYRKKLCIFNNIIFPVDNINRL